MHFRKVNDEVLYAQNDIVCVHQADIEELKLLADGNLRKRIRLCAHLDESDNLHEMLIVLGKDNYIRPHRHPGKSESFHVIEGAADVILFDEDGNRLRCVKLGTPGSGLCSYFRMGRFVFHTLIVLSDFFVFLETTNGPFVPTGTQFADWAPEESDIEAGQLFLKTQAREW